MAEQDSTLLVQMLTDIKGDLKSLSDRFDTSLAGFESKLESKIPRQEYEARHRTLAEQVVGVKAGADAQAAALRAEFEALETKVNSNESKRADQSRELNVKAWGAIASGVLLPIIVWLIIGA